MVHIMTEKPFSLMGNGHCVEYILFNHSIIDPMWIYKMAFFMSSVSCPRPFEQRVINCFPEGLQEELYVRVYMWTLIHIYGYSEKRPRWKYDQPALKYCKRRVSRWLTGTVALDGGRSRKSPALHSERRAAVPLIVNPSCEALSTVCLCLWVCVRSWWDFILSSSGAEIWEPVGEQRCWEAFGGSVQVPSWG